MLISTRERFAQRRHFHALFYISPPKIFVLLFGLLLAGCSNADSDRVLSAQQLSSVVAARHQTLTVPNIQSSGVRAARVITATPYLDQVDIELDDVKYLSLVESALPLNSQERELLDNNGFAVSDRYNWERFLEAYAWIYWKDLPVLVTTDAMLHAFHQSYVDLLVDLEHRTLKPQLAELLEGTRTTLAEQRTANSDPALDPLYADVDTYLSVALHLLNEEEAQDSSVQPYVALATDADAYAFVELFGKQREIDFTLFKPRAHYAAKPWLQGYFRAMSWLGLIDFRFVSYSSGTNEPLLEPSQIAAAAILREVIDGTDQRLRWSIINSILELLIGRSDNTTLPDLDRFMVDAGVTTPSEILAADEATLLDLLTNNDYGQQRITGQLLQRHVGNPSDEPVPPPISFMLLGQRFALDSFVLSELVYDRIIVDGEPIERALPSTLDITAALGDSRARTHLAEELATYQYEPNLDALQQTIDELPASYWRAPVYNQWLGLLRTINQPTTAENYPQALRTAAWADKMLQTQLGTWTQLRHDNILYVKQSYTQEQAICEYPAGYVEPYPEFFGALADLAHDVRQALDSISQSATGVSYSNQRIKNYLRHLEDVSGRFQTLAEKELRLEEFTHEEEIFLKSMVKREIENVDTVCAGFQDQEYWDGWYTNLFYANDDNPALIADVHTNPTRDSASSLYPPRVLHAATGPAVAQFLIVDTDEGAALYVGAAFSYYDVLTIGDSETPPERYNDQQWRSLLASGGAPAPPEWTQSFRLPSQGDTEQLELHPSANVRFRLFERPWLYLPVVR